MSYKTFVLNHRLPLQLTPAARGSTNSGWVNVFGDGNGANRAVYELTIGTVTGDVTWKLTQATDSSGTGAKDITDAVGATITTANDNSISYIEFNSGSLDLRNGFAWVRAEITVASGTPISSLKLIQHQMRRNGEFEQDATVVSAVDVSN